MAKKARRRLEEDEVYRSFEFPEFDELKFLVHEFEQTWATILAFALALVLGVVSFAVGRLNVSPALAPVVGLALLLASPWAVQRLRPGSKEYTKGEWAGLLLMEVFGWLGVWFLLADLVH